MLMLINGCGGKTAPVVPIDPVIERYGYAGQSALALERPRQAVEQFQRALARARERDDAGAIGDLGFNLAVPQLPAGKAPPALRTPRRAQRGPLRRSRQPRRGDNPRLPLPP